MVLGLLLRDSEERHLIFDFEEEAQLFDRTNDGEYSKTKCKSGISKFLSSEEDGIRKDCKRGTVVCRHWLRGLCMKGDTCEFLHQYDMSKMPECRWGMECQVPECPFRHVPDEDRLECAFYRQGFCSHGPNCRYRHIKLAGEECPETADFSLQSKAAEEENVKRRKTQPVNEFYKIAICKHWEKLGTCPFGDECHFAHGDHELRPFPRQNEMDKNGFPDANGMMDVHTIPPQISHGMPEMVDMDRNSAYFVLHSFSYLNVAHSVHYKRFAASVQIQQQLKAALDVKDVFVFITVTASKHFQGVARLDRNAFIVSNVGVDLAFSTVPYETETRSAWDGAFPIEYLRICECPYDRAQFPMEPPAMSCMELSPTDGSALLHVLFAQPPIQLHYKSVEDEHTLQGGAEELANRRRQAAESLFHGNQNEFPPSRYKIPMPGFIFACNNSNIDECFGRMLFGLSKEQESIACKHVMPGTPLFLLNVSDRHLLGIFEAVTPCISMMVPNAFAHSSHGFSPFPVQVRFVIRLNAPAISAADSALKQIFGERGARMGPLTLHITQKVVDVFAERSNSMYAPPPPTFNQPAVALCATRVHEKEEYSVPTYFEKILVGIENDSEFCVTKRIIGPGGAYMKNIIAEAGGNAKIRLRGRGSGSKEPGAEEIANDPLAILLSSENERSFSIACEQAKLLLQSIHQDYQKFIAQKNHSPSAVPYSIPGEEMQDAGIA